MNDSFSLHDGMEPIASNPSANNRAAARARSSYLSPLASSGARRVAAAMHELSQVAPADEAQ